MTGARPGIADPWAFVFAVWVFLMIPGPGNLVLIGATGKAGCAAGWPPRPA